VQVILTMATMIEKPTRTMAMAARVAFFCAENQAVPLAGLYRDADECAKEANRMNGFCSPNPAELQLSVCVRHHACQHRSEHHPP
jgi:hypothetical protein